LGGEHQQVGWLGQGRQRPGEQERKGETAWRVGVGVVLLDDLVFEAEQSPRVDLEGEVQVDGAVAGFLGVEVDLPGLAQRVRLHEVALVVDVEAVVDGMVLQVGHEAGDIDDRHMRSSEGNRNAPACHVEGDRRAAATVTAVPTALLDPASVLTVLGDAAAAIAEALAATADWGEAGTRPGQHHSDLAADAAAVAVLDAAGYGVLSEESGRHGADRALTVVLDPLDGSTNASRRLSWWATSLAAVDGDGLLASLVVDLRHGTRYTAIRGGGAWRDGEPIRASGCSELGDAIVGLNGVPVAHGGWAQYRALGAAALDLCAVADGTLDGFADATTDELGPWDFLGAVLVCREAGATVFDAAGRDLVVLEHSARRIPIAGATPALADALQRGVRPDLP
ncbi:MAG: inositol monophosphatase/fructose,6-bisphosphatase family protein, partial [Acidimicrobiales bacterium]|nr:inositol monophosphatase/fructose,6-bisphosphatase family protein [Acidimicrobiales bacterium]